tara:strand:+ start:377 stop:1105 length:729 start_codon:yes stop_codon:yes gene_type:complete
MKSLECLTKECITLLENNQVLKTLIKNQLGNETISNVIIENSIKKKVINQSKNKLNLKDEFEFKKWLEEKSITNDQFEQLTLRETKIKTYCKKNFDHKVGAWFLERKSNLDMITYSLLRIKEYHKAREFYFRIQEGEADFGYLASIYSEGFERKARGIVGPTQLANAHPKLIEKLTSSRPGEVQEPILISDMYLVIRVESYEPAQLDEPMRARMQEELFGQWLEEESDLIRQKLLSKANLSN